MKAAVPSTCVICGNRKRRPKLWGSHTWLCSWCISMLRFYGVSSDLRIGTAMRPLGELIRVLCGITRSTERNRVRREIRRKILQEAEAVRQQRMKASARFLVDVSSGVPRLEGE
jgi:hypothetical protein